MLGRVPRRPSLATPPAESRLPDRMPIIVAPFAERIMIIAIPRTGDLQTMQTESQGGSTAEALPDHTALLGL